MTGSPNITLKCAADAAGSGCGESISAQTYEDKIRKERRPVQPYPHICLSCWRKGWRYDAPMKNGDPWRIYRDEKAPQPAEGQ